MQQNLTVSVFAVGSAIKFKKSKLLRSDGSSEYYSLVRLLLKNDAIKRLVILSKSDWNRLTPQERLDFDPNGKIFDPYTEFPELNKRKKPENIEERRQYYMKFNDVMQASDVKIDFGIGFTSQGWSNSALPGYLNTLKPPFKPVKCLDMTLYYASDIVYYLNMSNMPWWLLATDPRYVKPSMRERDIVNLPRKILGQQDFDIEWFGVRELKRDASLENNDYVIRERVSRYSGIEKMNLIDAGVADPETTNKPEKFTIVSMQLSSPSSTEDLRFDILKEYILDRDKDKTARIFGKWSDFFKKDNPQLKGYIATEDLDRTFMETRYTLVLPTAAGWVTSKYAEMLQLAVIPFLHPTYDTQYHIVPKDHPLRVKDANDFYEKMDYYDNNPNERIKFVKQLQEELISDAYTGEFMINLINHSLEEEEFEFSLDNSEKSLYKKKTKVIKPKVNKSLF